MPPTSPPRIRYAPRGVVRKQVAMRLFPSELSEHLAIAQKAGVSSSSMARKIYLSGLSNFRFVDPKVFDAAG